MFRQKRNRTSIGNWIGLREVFHCLDQVPLSINVTRIGRALAGLLATDIGRDWDSENLSHVAPNSIVNLLFRLNF